MEHYNKHIINVCEMLMYLHLDPGVPLEIKKIQKDVHNGNTLLF